MTRIAPRALDAARCEADARAAALHLAAACPTLDRVIASLGTHRPCLVADPFRTLIESITQQQISMKAAAAVFARIKAACPRRRLSPAAILGLTHARLCAAGLSRPKAHYVRNVAAAFGPGGLTRRRLERLGDDDVIAALSAIKGVGRWTAEMVLIFALGRPDVWPVDDLGLRRAVQRLYGHDDLPALPALRAWGERFRPYRTYASWYLWRAREGVGMPGIGVAPAGAELESRRPAANAAAGGQPRAGSEAIAQAIK